MPNGREQRQIPRLPRMRLDFRGAYFPARYIPRHHYGHDVLQPQAGFGVYMADTGRYPGDAHHQESAEHAIRRKYARMVGLFLRHVAHEDLSEMQRGERLRFDPSAQTDYPGAVLRSKRGQHLRMDVRLHHTEQGVQQILLDGSPEQQCQRRLPALQRRVLRLMHDTVRMRLHLRITSAL